MPKKKIGFVGLGRMGRLMSMNLLKAGFKLTVYDLKTEVLQDLAQQGAVAVGTAAEVAENSDVVIFTAQL